MAGPASRTRAEVEAKSLARVGRVGDWGGERGGRLGAERGEDWDMLDASEGREGLGGRLDWGEEEGERMARLRREVRLTHDAGTRPITPSHEA